MDIKHMGVSILLGTHTDPPLTRVYSRHIRQGQAVFYASKTHVSRFEDSQYWVNKRGLGGAAYTMIQNHKGGFDSASGMSKSARE